MRGSQKKNDYLDCKPASTPYNPSVKLFKNEDYGVRQQEYESTSGSLMYAADSTRLEIAYVVGLMASLVVDLVWSIGMLLRGSRDTSKKQWTLGCNIVRFPAVFEGYDADWNILLEDSKVTSSYIFNIAGGAVSWKTTKQTI